MAKKLSTIMTSMKTNAAATATAIGGSVTAAEVTALAELFDVLKTRKDLLFPALKLCSLATQIQLQPE